MPKIKVLGDSLTGEKRLPGSWMAVISLSPHMT